MFDGTVQLDLWPEEAEEWKPVKGYSNYLVSSWGRIYSIPRKTSRGGILKLSPDRLGYLCVGFWENGKTRTFRVHTLVATAFLGPRPKGAEVLHGPNGNRDNRASQLRYGTHQENMIDMVRYGVAALGEDHRLARLTKEIVAECRIRNDGSESYLALAEEFGVDVSTMGQAIRGKTWRHVTTPPRQHEGNRRGSRHSGAKLTEDIVFDCRNRYAQGEDAYLLACEFGVTEAAMRFAISGHTWKHVPMPEASLKPRARVIRKRRLGPCKTPGCKKPAIAKDLCGTCYSRESRRAKKGLPPSGRLRFAA